MAFDLNRWVQYAKARLDRAVGTGNAALDRREAQLEAEAADKPWLRAEGEAPTLDEAKARIQWEAERQRRDADAAAPATPPIAAEGPAAPAPDAKPAAPLDPAEVAANAEAQQARLELEARQEAAAQRLEAIRQELGVDASPDAPTT